MSQPLKKSSKNGYPLKSSIKNEYDPSRIPLHSPVEICFLQKNSMKFLLNPKEFL